VCLFLFFASSIEWTIFLEVVSYLDVKALISGPTKKKLFSPSHTQSRSLKFFWQVVSGISSIYLIYTCFFFFGADVLIRC
jgi:hypothetical protein